MKKRLVLGTTIFLITLLVSIVLMQAKNPSAQEIDYSKYQPYPSPDGSFALLQERQTGAVLLYSLKEQSLIQRYDEQIGVPFVGGAMWSRQSKRFLLLSHNPPEYIVMDVETLKSWRLNLSPFQDDGVAGLKAVLSPDGKEVIAETDKGIILWDIERGAVHEFKLDLEVLADLYSLTWVRPKQFVARFGARSPRLVLYDAEKRQAISITSSLPLKETRTLPWATSDGRIVLWTKHSEQRWLGLLNPYSGEVELLISQDAFDKEGASLWELWGWNSNPEHPVLYGIKRDETGLKLVRLNLSDRSVEGTVFIDTPFGVDAQGRIWQAHSEGIVQYGLLSRK